MQIYRQRLSGKLQVAAIALLAGGFWYFAAQANAVPFTNHFDPLITDLQTREAALSNSTDKVGQAQFKTIVKVLKTLNGKDSTSLATDIKNLGSVAKTLIKAFPTDYTPPGSSLLTNTETALDGLIDDVQTAINTTTTNLNALAASSCKDKAQTGLNTAQSQLNSASVATDFPTAAKLLGSALKTELKADGSVTKCSSQGSGGGHGGGGGGNGLGDSVSATLSGSLNLNFKAIMGPDGFVAAGQYNPVSIITIEAGYAPGGTLQQSMVMYVDNVTGPGTYPIEYISQFDQELPTATDFLGAEGSVTFTTADFVKQQLIGSFEFTAPELIPSNTGMVTVTSGMFNISRIPTIPVKVPTNTNFMTATDNGFAFWGSCTGQFVTNSSNLLITGEHTVTSARTITLVLDNPTSTGVAYPIQPGSLYTDERNVSTIYQANPSGEVVFSTLDIPSGLAEGTFTFSVGQSTPPGTNIVTVINGYFKESNITTH